MPGCLIFLIVVFSISLLAFGGYSLYQANNPETTDSYTSEPAEGDESQTYDSGTTGEYGNYFLGLVYDSGVILSGNGCYDDSEEFIVLINNRNAKDPTYSELLNFLRNDTTDSYAYQPVVSVGGFYYGDAEDLVNIDRIHDIIDGIVQPSPPKVCADFAERLHNEAEMAGIRCAYVSVELSGVGHALNAFQTTDRGLVYIDDTGTVGSYGPTYSDTVVDVRVGQQYIPVFLFDTSGWFCESMGTVTSILIIWDGEWND